jgi:murein DD-endopeptidase MepM/ murein hydrolase activator NlpD
MSGRQRVRLLLPLILLLSCAPPLAATPLQTQVEPEQVVPGTPLKITVSGLSPDTQLEGSFLGVDLTFMFPEDGRRVAFAGVDLDVEPGSHVLLLQARDTGGGGAVREHSVEILVENKTYPTEELKVAPKYVNPPDEVSQRIARESASLKTLWEQATPEALFDGTTVRPLSGVLGRNFGRRRVFNGQPKSPHSGTDLSAGEGTPVPASARGRVVMARDLYYSGNLVVLDHGGGVYTLYAHLSRMGVGEGDLVDAGQEIGQVGSTGRVTGAHLHWGARIGEARVDPAVLLELLSGVAGNTAADQDEPRT